MPTISQKTTKNQSRTASSFSLDKDRLIKSIYRISTFLSSPSQADEISKNMFLGEFSPVASFNPDSSYVDGIMTKILDEVVDKMGFDRGIICLLDDTRENLITRVVKNYSPEEAKHAFSTPLNLVRHDSFETRVAKTGQYLVLEDSDTDPRLTETDRKITRFYNRGSTFYAPLSIEDEVIGIIAVWTKEKSSFLPDEIEILLTFANQVSIIINISRLFENNRDRIHRLLILQRAVSELHTNYDIGQLHEILLRNALQLAGARKGLIVLIEPDESRHCFIHEGLKIVPDDSGALKFRVDKSIIRKALDADAIMIQQVKPELATSTHVFRDCTSEIAFPLKVKDRFRGAIHLAKEEGLYSQDQINALDILVKHAAAAYDNAIMHSLLSLEAKSLKSEVEQLKERESVLLGFDNILGNSKPMMEIFRIVQDVAKHNTNILIQGESGTGKELVARAIHRQSDRSPKKFVEVNCAAIPGTLLESELFGYEAGAFTDAKKRKQGLLEFASGGTMLLDEVGDMSMPLQAKFLRMLEDGFIRRLGGTEKIPIDVRFIFSTNKNLGRLVSENLFREDLLYRIRVVPITIPPLRERADDILLLARHYIEEFNKKFNRKVKGFSRQADLILKRYPWPGNVRELKNIIERVMILQNVGKVIQPENLPAEIKNQEFNLQALQNAMPEVPETIDFKTAMGQLTNDLREHMILSALEKSRGKKTAAAKILGISRYTLIRELKKLGRN